MPKPADPARSSCPHCQSDSRPVPIPRRSRLLGWLGGRELLVGAAALGLVASLGWVCEGSVCERLDANPAALAERDAALEGYLTARCDAGQCESIKVVSSSGCRAKVRVVERRFDDYGDVLGSFRVDEGLEFSPMLDRWRLRETLVDKQVLGLPSY